MPPRKSPRPAEASGESRDRPAVNAADIERLLPWWSKLAHRRLLAEAPSESEVRDEGPA